MSQSGSGGNKDAGASWESVLQRGQYDLTEPDPALVSRILALRKSDGGAYLDLGCGLGRYLAPVASYGGLAVGLDCSETAVRASRVRSGVYGHLVRGSMTDLPFPDGVFGTVLAWRAIYLQDMSRIRRTISEVRRVLKPGGHFIGSARSVENALFYVGKAVGKEIEPGTFYYENDEFPGVTYHFFTEDELFSLLSGFSIQDIHSKNLTHTQFTIDRQKHPNAFLVFLAKKSL